MTEKKGLIRNRKRVKQVIDFTGVQNGKLHPSDIDAVLEFDNEVLILIEVKYKFTTTVTLIISDIIELKHPKKSADFVFITQSV